MDREAWRATVCGVAKSRTWLRDSHTHIRTAGGLLSSGDYQANGGCHGEEKMFVAALSLYPKKNLEGKSEVCERYSVAFAMEFDSSFFSLSP